MNIGEYSVRTPVISWLLVIILIGGGIWGFQNMGKLEDPAFTIKSAKIITYYPGANAQQVQDEVTYHIEDALQRMEQVKRIKMSISRPGMSDINVEFKDKYRGKDFPNIFDELRRKIQDMRSKLPPGALDPIIVDDFGDVYGVYLALHGEGYTYRDLYDAALNIKKQLVLVDGVRKVEIGGEQKEVVYVDISRARLAELGIPLEQIAAVLKTQNVVQNAGHVRVGDDYLRIEPTGEFTSVKAIGDVLISSSDKKLFHLKDIASITRAYEDRPGKLYYVNGKPSLTLGISMVGGQNVVEVGQRLEQRFHELLSIVPLGMQITPIYNQPGEVDKSVNGFLVSVAQAVAIVILVLLVFMGLRVGMIIGTVLLITVAGTLLFMHLYGIELQRISLGALVIALGMLVDNAIVVAEGMLVRIKAGMGGAEAARETVGKTIWALLGGTIIGILAFSAIGLSPDSTGEFASSLFWVILISLLLSWITAISTTPLLCAWLIKPDKQARSDSDPYAGRVFQIYRGFVKQAVRVRYLTALVVAGLFVAALIGFGYVKQSFFPNSNTPMFFVDVWEPEGSDIRRTRDDTLQIAEFLRQQEGVVQTTTVVGGGHQRFSLTYDPKESSATYAQVIVQTETREKIAGVWQAVDTYMRDVFPDVDPIIKALRIGPGRDGKIEARFHGPDAEVLRDLSDQAQAIMRSDPEAKDIRDDWRQPVKLVKPVFNEQVGRQLGITRENLASALAYAFEGTPMGQYRDGIRLLPIYARAPADEREDIANIQDILVYSPVLGQSVPIAQVVSHFETVWVNTIIRGRDRIQTIIAQCNPTGELATPLFNRLRPQIEAIELPPGYSLSWGGEYEDSANAQGALFKALPAGFLMMILVSVLLFGKIRQPTIIWLTVPLAIIGITAGLLVFNGAFDFMSLLGALALIGLLIKNAIVLIDEIDQQIEAGKEKMTAILDAAVSRMRPVVLAAATTILGMIPLLPDVFFVNMSLTIMAGLAFATILTLVIVPVLYAILFKVPYRAEA
jgi:multidrug efflux pump subunit AcrB